MSDDTEYEVGYCKPPRKNQFKSGQSGNPKGRPKQSGSANDAFRKYFVDAKYKTKDGKTINGLDLTMLKLAEAVNDKRPTAIRQVLELAQQYAPEEIKVILPYIPTRAELAEYYADELADDEFSGQPKRH
jgi:hypothetical protein